MAGAGRTGGLGRARKAACADDDFSAGEGAGRDLGSGPAEEDRRRSKGYEARYFYQNPVSDRGGVVVRAPNADLSRDPRWGRTEESMAKIRTWWER